MARKEYVVEKVIDKKVEKGKVLYLVKWEDYGDEEDSWEPEKNLAGCLGKIRQYESKKNPSPANASPTRGRGRPSKSASATPAKKKRQSESRPSKSASATPAKKKRQSESGVERETSLQEFMVVDNVPTKVVGITFGDAPEVILRFKDGGEEPTPLSEVYENAEACKVVLQYVMKNVSSFVGGLAGSA